MKEHPLFPWDHYSDQPRIMRDKKLKRKIYRKAVFQMVTSGSLLIFFPLIYLLLLCKKSWKPSNTKRCIGLSVHLETECPGKTIIPIARLQEMVNDLNVNQLLVRIKLADIDNFNSYIKHIDALSSNGREISINLIQDRQLLDDPKLLDKALNTLLPLLKDRTKHIHVGNAYNRRKWAFYHFGEYQQFFRKVRQVAKAISPETKLIGGSVIDFEIPPFFESLFHFRRGKYDGYSSQLYIDRRGAPENTQAGFHFLKKINLVALMQKLSWKTSGELWISEINWPLKNSGKFAPCKGKALVSPLTQADYLTRAYLTAMASGNVRTCFWHQLIAPGYGLVDNRPVPEEKYPSYYAFKTITQLFNDAYITHFHDGNYLDTKGLYALKAKTKLDNTDTDIIAIWSTDIAPDIQLEELADRWISQDGTKIKLENLDNLKVSQTVIYGITNHW